MKSFRRMVGVLTVVIALALVMLFAISTVWAEPKAGSMKQQIVGTWSLVAQYVEQEGKKVERFGTNPKGIVIYERNGHFAAIMLRSNLPKFASNNAMKGTPEENKAIVEGSTAYYGRWSVNEKDRTVTTHIEGCTYPNWDGQDQKRIVSISGDELKGCIPGGAQIGGTVCAVWKRVK